MQTKNIAVVLVAVALMGSSLWFAWSAGTRVGAVEERLRSISAGIEPIHLRCQALEYQLAETERALDVLKQEFGDADSESQRLVSQIDGAQALIGALKREFLEFSEETESSLSGVRQKLEEQEFLAPERDERIGYLADRLTWLEGVLERFPAGTILPWLPEEEGIPEGWLLCDGSAGTPDLRGLFLRGVTRLDQSGRYFDGAAMQPAGLHSHSTDLNRSIYSLPRATTKSAGDWLLLFDAGIKGSDPNVLSSHGSHVHEDQHVPAHFTVLYIMKDSRR